MINSILENSQGDVAAGSQEQEAFLALKAFMYDTVYIDRTAKQEERKVDKVDRGTIRILFEPPGADVQFLSAACLSGRPGFGL